MMSDQGTEYAAFIATELGHEYDRRDAVTSRAGAVISSSTGLVTLILAVIAVAKGKDYVPKGSALGFLIGALIALLGSALLAVLAGINWQYKVTSVESMRDMVGTAHWKDSEVTARGIVTYCNMATINSLRKGTNIKFRLLLTSAVAQVTAIVALSVTVLLIVH